ncbi:MAG: hypothetical protein JWP42_1291 [Pseudomonas sp.]|nr:hypothetical protein [Pseudomonas sp.]
MIDTAGLAATAKALEVQMKAAGMLPPLEAFERVDQLFAGLETDAFLKVRTLQAFWALLALLEVPASPSEVVEAGAATGGLPPDEFARPCDTPAAEALRLPHPKTAINDVHLSGRYDKLIFRLRRSVAKSPGLLAPIERLEDILSLSEETMLKLGGVGQTYRDDWQALKALYAQPTGEFLPTQPEIVQGRELSFYVHDDMVLNLMRLEPSERKALAKLERALGIADINTLMDYSSADLMGVKALGNRSVTGVLQIQRKLIDELLLIASGDLDYRTDQQSLITTQAQSFDSVEALGTFVLARLDSYLAGLDETRQLVFQYRWGFVEERLTLSDIGDKFNVSRERIRQVESKVNEELRDCLMLDTDEIWHTVQTLNHAALRLQMEDLCSCFTDQGYFQEFLAFISHGRLSSLSSLNVPALGLLDAYFALHGKTVSEAQVLQHLQHSLGVDERSAHNALLYLHAQGQLALLDGQVRPLRLSKHDAAAAVLSDHANGLPWLDIVRHANNSGLSRTPFSEQGGGHGLHDSDLMYVSGKGVYRHTRYVDFGQIDDAAIFAALHAYFVQSGQEVTHLSEAYGESAVLRQYDYYLVRYVVKMRGSSHGVFFNGKSQTDSVSLIRAFDLYSQKDVIVQALQRRQAPMTKTEVAQLLKSKSLEHASLYVNELMNANLVVQIDRMLYTTPELAYENTDLNAMRQAIEGVLLRHAIPVDPSVIQVELNLLQGRSYSKYFYGSLARYFAQQQHWLRRQNLFSLQPIGFRSLTGAIEALCSPEASMEVNIEVLRGHIAITEDSAKVSLYNWKAAKVRSAVGVTAENVEEEIEND